MGFLTGHELTWMPEASQIVMRDELPNIDVMISSQYSPQLADAFNAPLAVGRITGAGVYGGSLGMEATEPVDMKSARGFLLP
jgi:hypothetical protein